MESPALDPAAAIKSHLKSLDAGRSASAPPPSVSAAANAAGEGDQVIYDASYIPGGDMGEVRVQTLTPEEAARVVEEMLKDQKDTEAARLAAEAEKAEALRKADEEAKAAGAR